MYLKALGRNLQRIVKINQTALTQNPDHAMASIVPKTLALNNPTLDLFDSTFTSKVGASCPPFPFPSVTEYYQWASSHHSLPHIRVPFLAINATDDPVVRDFPIASGNGWAVIALTRCGGHLGWWTNKKERWIVKPVLEWLQATGDSIHHTRWARNLYELDGWLKEEGAEHLGCRVVQMTSVIPNSLNHHDRLAQTLGDGEKAPTAGL